MRKKLGTRFPAVRVFSLSLSLSLSLPTSLRASACGPALPPRARARVIRSASPREVRIFVSAGGIRWRRPPLTRCVVVLFSWLDCAGRRGVGADRLPCSLARARENEFILVFSPLFFIFIFAKPACLGGDELRGVGISAGGSLFVFCGG